jgi:excisionase family DNA binding protein
MDRLELMSEGAVGIKDATKLAGVSRAFLYEAMRRGELPYCKVGWGKGKRVIPRRALAQWLADNLIATQTDAAYGGRS